jgi:hypothetical protein
MIKNLLFVIALLSLALAGGCAKGGNGVVPPPVTVDVAITSPVNANGSAIYPTQTLTLTATVSNSTNSAVTWSLTGAGTLTPVTPATSPATATYVAPATAGSQPTITATSSVAQSSVSGSLPLSIIDITTDVAPAPASLNIGKGLTQQFTATAVPDDAPQTFNWTCTANGVPCKSFHQDPNVSGLAYYSAQDACGANCVQISALSPLDPTGCSNPKNCTIAKASIVTSRVSGTYAFRFSGYDSSHNPTAVAGTFTVAPTAAVTAGVEDELTSTGFAQYPITSALYSPISASDPNSNNAGTLSLTLPAGIYPNQFQAVLDGAGDIKLIESDGHGTGSGIARASASSNVFNGNQTFAFGFTGVDSTGHPVGYAGLLPMDGSGAIIGGQMDSNDNGSTSNICGASPCGITGSYLADGGISGLWHIGLTSSGASMKFDFFISSGTANKTNPLTFYAISADAIDATHPAVAGTMVLQDSTQTYNNAALKGTSVSALTGANGANSNVSLMLGTTDGNGNFSGQFDQNNAGTILSAIQFPPAVSNNYTYAATGTNGRYTFQMLGNPTANPVVAPLPFVLYASGQNRGFLLDQSSSSVLTGTMNPQGKGSGFFAGSEMPGTYALATTSSASPTDDPIAANLLLTEVNTGACTAQCINGTLYDTANPTGVTLAGGNPAYAIQRNGSGTITLTAPSSQKYVIYVQDTLGCTTQSPACEIQDFLMMDVDPTNPDASIMFAQQ